VTQNLSLIYQIRDSGSGQILQPRQLYLSPGLAKTAPYFAPSGLTALYFLLGHYFSTLNRSTTLTTFIAGPLAVRAFRNDLIASAQAKVWLPSHKVNLTLPNTCFF
jgi:hypothetical protein